jgi:hypothetical protein
MLGSISPVGEASRKQRWWLTATADVSASTTAGLTLGLALGGAGSVLLGSVSADARLVALGVLIVAATATDTGAFGSSLPSWRRQVDERWLSTYRGWVYVAGFGAQLGAAIVTIVPSAVTYAALGAALLSASWRAGLAIGAVFGLGRAVPLLLLARVRTPEQLYRVARRLADAEPWAHRATIGVQGVLATAAVFAAVTR